MVFNPRRLTVLVPETSFWTFGYMAPGQLLEDMCRDNYFGRADEQLRVGDVIAITASDGRGIVVVTVSDLQTVVTAPLNSPAGNVIAERSNSEHAS